MQPIHLLQKLCLTQVCSQGYAREAWDAMVLKCFVKSLSDGTFSLKICILFTSGFDRGFQVSLADLNLKICSPAGISIQRAFLKNQSLRELAWNELNWTSSPIPSQGSINYTFNPVFGIDSNFSFSSVHNSLYFNTAINNQFEVDFKIF